MNKEEIEFNPFEETNPLILKGKGGEELTITADGDIELTIGNQTITLLTLNPDYHEKILLDYLKEKGYF